MREQHPKPRQLRNRATPSAAGDRPTETSDWNPTQHTLRWQGHVVKHFKAQAPYQKALVDEFAAQGWSPSEHLQPVQVVTADGRALSYLSWGPSSSSIRLIGTCRLLGQKVRVLISNRVPRGLVVRIVWTCPVGDDLIENGGAILADADLPDCMISPFPLGHLPPSVRPAGAFLTPTPHRRWRQSPPRSTLPTPPSPSSERIHRCRRCHRWSHARAPEPKNRKRPQRPGEIQLRRQALTRRERGRPAALAAWLACPTKRIQWRLRPSRPPSRATTAGVLGSGKRPTRPKMKERSHQARKNRKTDGRQ